MEYVKQLISNQKEVTLHEYHRARNQGHAGKAARLWNEYQQLRHALITLETYVEVIDS